MVLRALLLPPGRAGGCRCPRRARPGCRPLCGSRRRRYSRRTGPSPGREQRVSRDIPRHVPSRWRRSLAAKAGRSPSRPVPPAGRALSRRGSRDRRSSWRTGDSLLGQPLEERLSGEARGFRRLEVCVTWTAYNRSRAVGELQTNARVNRRESGDSDCPRGQEPYPSLPGPCQASRRSTLPPLWKARGPPRTLHPAARGRRGRPRRVERAVR